MFLSILREPITGADITLTIELCRHANYMSMQNARWRNVDQFNFKFTFFNWIILLLFFPTILYWESVFYLRRPYYLRSSFFFFFFGLFPSLFLPLSLFILSILYFVEQSSKKSGKFELKRIAISAFW